MELYRFPESGWRCIGRVIGRVRASAERTLGCPLSLQSLYIGVYSLDSHDDTRSDDVTKPRQRMTWAEYENNERTIKKEENEIRAR